MSLHLPAPPVGVVQEGAEGDRAPWRPWRKTLKEKDEGDIKMRMMGATVGVFFCFSPKTAPPMVLNT